MANGFNLAQDMDRIVARIERQRAQQRLAAEELADKRKRFQGLVRELQRTVEETMRAPEPKAAGLETIDEIGSLTVREKEVLRLIAEGCSTKETAFRLGITFKTAACHRYRVMQKLNLRDTASLVRLAIRNHLVTP
jgi:DNA-binding NarL/FixJ family response regulator